MGKIHLVDDSETLRRQLRVILENSGHQVVESSDGVDALDLLEKTPDVELIICDLNMPRMDGMTFCRRVSENPTHSKIPIFILTTEVGTQLKAEAKKFGVRAWIIKPFSPEKLISAVSQILGKKNG